MSHESAANFLRLPKHALVLSLLLAACGASWANPAVDDFSRCLSDNTTGKDRKALARWLFVSMGAHPEMRAITTLPPTASEDEARIAGQLFTRLLTEACARQTQAAVRAVGPIALQSGFTVLGQLAMQELMTDKDVAAGMSALQRHLDTAKLETVLNPK